MAYILNIETATDICSIAIAKEGKLSAFRECTTTNHAAHINLLIHECLEEMAIKITDLSAVAISNGPGSYTSLRVGASTAKGICHISFADDEH